MQGRVLKLLLASLAVLLAAPALASAATFCVRKSSCTGTDHTTFESALAAAAANGAAEDRIELGFGTFTASDPGGFVNNAGSDVKIVGFGQGSTTLTRATSGNVLSLNDPNSSVSDLSVRIPTGPNSNGIVLSGLAERVAVSAASGATGAIGVNQTGNAIFRRSSVSFPVGSTAAENTGVFGAGTAEDLSVAAPTAFGGGSFQALTIRRVVAAATSGVTSFESSVTVEDAVFDLGQGPGARDPIGLDSGPEFGFGSVLTARHVTLRGDDSSGSVGMRVVSDFAPPGGASTSTLTASDSIVRNFATHLRRDGAEDCNGAADCPANMTISYSDYDFSKTDVAEVSPNFGSFSGGTANNNVNNIDPRFRSGSDLRLRYDSPLIDIGTPGLIPASQSQTDAAGKARLRDGKAPFNGRRRDMGAYEYQRLAPTARATATPGSVRPGQKATFGTIGSFDPDGDPLTYSWLFDDGATVVSPRVEKRFDEGGEHAGTVTATDPTGLTDTATATLSDEFAPELDVASLSVKGRTARVKLDCDEDEGEDCEGSISVRSLGRIELSAKKKVKLGSRKFDLDPGQVRTVKVKLRKRMLRRIERRKLRLRLVITAKDDAGNRVVLKRKRTLKLKRKS